MNFSLLLSQLHNKISVLLNRLDRETRFPFLVLGLLPLLLLLMFPFSWNGNEEKYFISAYQRVAPDLFPPFHAVFDQSNAKFLSEYLLGVMVNIFGYETAHSSSRTLMAILYAISLGGFFSTLRLSLLQSMAIIAVFYFFDQQLLGGEWLFQGVEAKTFSYASVISALTLAWRQNWLGATLFMVLATYFHFLVGGFWALALTLFIYLHTNNLRLAIRTLGFYVLLISPLVIDIAINQLGHPPITTTPGPDKIYAMRVPHHITPFASMQQLKHWYPGILETCSFLFAFLLLRKFADDKRFITFISILLSYLLIALLISFLDRNTLIVAKFFLFRPSSLILLLAIMCIFILVESKCNIEGKNVLRIAQAAIALYFISKLFVPAAYALYKGTDNSLPQQPALIRAIEANSKPDEIVLIEPYKEMTQPYVGLPRILPRPTLVSRKFTPNNPVQLEHWYKLINFRRKLFENGCTQPLPYPVRLLLVFQPLTLEQVENCGEIVWQGKQASLIRVHQDLLPTQQSNKDTASPLQ
jgi:hypothetical protein